jgi:death-on-curing protein
MGKIFAKTIQAKAARLGFSLVNNHAFVDGNKKFILGGLLF